MSWSNSKIFVPFITDVLMDTTQPDLGGTGVDAFKVALYNDSITPDQTVTAANSAYNVGQWATAQEVYQAAHWAQAGVALGSPAITNPTTTTVMFDAADTASAAGSTLAAVFGCLVYDDDLAAPVADQGVCYNYFGGSNSVSNGVLTVVWNGNGLFRITL